MLLECFVYIAFPGILLLLARIFYLLFNKNETSGNRKESVKTLIVLGSGGHTTEMLKILESLPLQCYKPRIYVYASNDKLSPLKAQMFEKSSEYESMPISRSRAVGQSYVSSVWTTLVSFGESLKLAWKIHPDLILCNGPGTCVPICIAIFLMKVFFLSSATIVFVESFCRVKTYSLTGLILYYIADNVIVQWPELCKNARRHVHLAK